MERSDEEILVLLTIDLDANYESLVVKYMDQLCRSIEYKGGSTQDAQDIVIETFERAYIRLNGYSPQQLLELRVRPWLYKIVDNLYINHVTRDKSIASISLDTLEETFVISIEDERSEQPDRILESAESRRELEDLVKSLPNTYQVVVYLHFFADLSYQEVADILNVKVGSVRTRVSRGLQVLRQMLEQQEHEEESKR
jgi:RNA polymerase sigma-70 factor (ECF subfamily)